MENITESTMETMENKKKAAFVLCVCFLIGALVSGIIFIKQIVDRERAEKQLEQLAENTEVTEEIQEEKADTAEEEKESDLLEALREAGIPIPEKEIDFADLQENTNADIYAWIYIPDSMIDYPVLQHPADNNYYLTHNLDGSEGYPGCIYSENYNTKDFTDPNTVLYGHNMKKGTMFAGLHKFEDSQYFEEHPYVYIYTPEKLLVYEIFAAYEFTDEHLLYNYDFTNEVIFQDYLDDILNTRSMNCNLREDVEVTAADKILTLSTCISTKPDNRYLVQGVLLNED